ncbi:hypothetical protein CsSME_00024458 [Camellia sinensis var. sinensis]
MLLDVLFYFCIGCVSILLFCNLTSKICLEGSFDGTYQSSGRKNKLVLGVGKQDEEDNGESIET